MRIEKLRQVFVVASDLERQLDFYTGALGLELQLRDGDRWVQLRAGDVSFALASPEEGMGVAPGVPAPVFQVDDLDAALAALGARGAAATVRDMGAHGRSARVADPGGAPLVLFQKGSAGQAKKRGR